MQIPIYQIDAFTSKLFSGNPAAVCPLDFWPEDAILQAIAAENNLSETAFFVRDNSHYQIRWMTPASEVNLCGHATLASAFVIFNYLDKSAETVEFNSRSGRLSAVREDDLIYLNFPSRKPLPARAPAILAEAVPLKASEVLFNGTYMLVFDREEDVVRMKPAIRRFLEVDTHGVIITAKGNEVDFVSRFFAPDVGINEDPVTGSAHTLLIPYWSEKLMKTRLHALQVSGRGGELFCEYLGSRVKIGGKSVLYMKGSIELGS